MKVLVIQTAFIGDAILATSVLEKLHQEIPEAQLYILVRQGNEGLFEEHPYIQNVLVWQKKKGKYKHLFRLVREVRRSKFDIVVNIQRYGAMGYLTWRSKAKQRIGFKKTPFSFALTHKVAHSLGDGRHEIERNQALIAHITSKLAAKPRLYPPKHAVKDAEQYSTEARLILFAPGSVWETKRVPVHQWVKLAEKQAPNAQIAIIGGANDSHLGEEIIAQSTFKNTVNLCGKLSLLGSAALISRAQRVFTGDSAPMHLASAMNAPVTAIFCSTIPQFGFGPLSADQDTIEISFDLPCRPCGLHGKASCPQGHFMCGNELPI